MSSAIDPSPVAKASGDPAEVHARVLEGMDLTRIIARQLRRQLGTRLEIEELESLGREGLLTAARNFDPTRGVPFRRWANLRVRGAMIDGIRSQGNLPRRVYRTLKAMEASDRVQDAAAEETSANPPTSARAADAKLSETLSGMAMAMAAGFLAPQTEGLERVPDDDHSPEEAVGRAQLLDRIRKVVSTRPDNERILVERHYFEGRTFDETAKELGLSKSWASRLHARAIEAIAHELKKQRAIG